MSKADYLALVDHLAARAGVAMSAELLHAQAMTWEIRHAGRTRAPPSSSSPACPSRRSSNTGNGKRAPPDAP